VAKVTIQDLGSVGELIAAIATVATLLYLALQIRQNTSASRGSGAASQTQADLAVSLLLAQDADVSRIFFDGVADPSTLSERDHRRFDSLMNSLVANQEQAWRFHNEGAIDGEQWEAMLSFLRWVTHQPGFVEYWATWRSTSPAGFAQVVDRVSREASQVPLELHGAQQAAAADSG